jgi:hypothetical protein
MNFTGQLVHRLCPEESELELALVQVMVAERELFLTNLRSELSAFEARYLREVGFLYAELDDWNARIAEKLAERDGTAQSRSAAAQARKHAEESASAVRAEAANVKEFVPSAELKALFREVAKRVHPDLATGEGDRQTHETLMTRANAAYQRGDVEDLKRILEEYESCPESVRGVGVAADLERISRQIRQLRRRLSQIELEIAGLIDSDVAKLKAKADFAKTEGRELLTEMAESVRRRIDVAHRHFEAVSAAAANA